MIAWSEFIGTFNNTITDVLPIASIIFGFQFAVLRRPVSNWPKVVAGFGYVILGLSLSLIGLELALFPLGETMAMQLTKPSFLQEAGTAGEGNIGWKDYYWVYCTGLMKQDT